ncbi:MAG: DUF4783 domain-containing protein [Chitinophagaceae bacterium]
MKKILALLGLGFILMSATNFGTPDEIIDTLKRGSAQEISQYFDNFIDLTLPEKDEMKNMGKNQATIAIKSFYEEMGIKSFQLTSQREAGSIMYITGKLQGKTKNTNLTLILKNTNNKYSITSIRIG